MNSTIILTVIGWLVVFLGGAAVGLTIWDNTGHNLQWGVTAFVLLLAGVVILGQEERK